MFHIIAKRVKKEGGSEFSAIRDSQTLTITHQASSSTIEVNRAELDDPNNGLIIYFSALNGFVTAKANDLVNQKDLTSYLAYAMNSGDPICAIMPNQSLTEAAAVFYKSVDVEGDVVESFNDCATSEAVDAVFPGTSEMRLRFKRAKVDLLRQIGANDSLASLEKQVDLLSILVIDLAEKQPENERPAWLPAFKSAVLQNSAVSFKGIDGAIEDFAEMKSKLRQLQAVYFAARGE